MGNGSLDLKANFFGVGVTSDEQVEAYGLLSGVLYGSWEEMGSALFGSSS